MNKQKILYLVVGLLAGFIVGFLFTNQVNRKEQDSLRAELARLRAAAPKTNDAKSNTPASADSATPQQLSDEELRKAIAKGDANPADIELQRKLGQGLYLYAINFGNTSILPDALRLLKRAHDANPKDYETTVMLGNAHFDMGQSGDSAQIDEARVYFTKALEVKPEAPDALTALGLTYFFDQPSDAPRAIREYRKALARNARHEVALQSLAAALISTGDFKEAEQRLDQLQQVNSSNAALADLRAQLAQKMNADNQQRAAGDAKERD